MKIKNGNTMIGLKIKSVDRIIELAEQKKSVCFHGTRYPARVIANWQLWFLKNQIIAGHITEYVKTEPV